jgi:hypothetical protein
MKRRKIILLVIGIFFILLQLIFIADDIVTGDNPWGKMEGIDGIVNQIVVGFAIAFVESTSGIIGIILVIIALTKRKKNRLYWHQIDEADQIKLRQAKKTIIMGYILGALFFIVIFVLLLVK